MGKRGPASRPPGEARTENIQIAMTHELRSWYETAAALVGVKPAVLARAVLESYYNRTVEEAENKMLADFNRDVLGHGYNDKKERK